MDSPYNRAIREIGLNGKFQKQFDVIYNIVLAALWVVAYNNIILALTITPHFCKLPNKPKNISEDLWKLQHIPLIENLTGRIKYDGCLIYNDTIKNSVKRCTEYYYDETWYGSTIPSENNWVCEKELFVANIFAYSKFGEIVGSLFFGWFGDVYGRKPTYIISLALLLTGRSISLLASTSYVLFAFGCILAYFPSWSVSQSAAVISIEISSPQRRSYVAKLRLIASSIGMCIMPLLYWWLRDWKIFMIVTTITQLPYLIFSWKIIESPQWLWVNQQYEKCIVQLKSIAKVNQTRLRTETENDILTRPLIDNKTEMFGILALFSGLRLSLITIFQLCFWIHVSVSYTAILMSSGEKLSGNPFLEFAWQSLAEIPGYLMAAWLADTIGRRYTGATSSIFTAIFWMVLGLGESSSVSWLKTGWMSTILVIANRLSITVSYYIINLYNMELYPTCLRQSGMSLGNVISGAAAALAPYILFLGRRFDASYPGIILAVISLTLGVIPSLLLPETLHAKLPETLEDAKKIGMHFVHDGKKSEIEMLQAK